MLRKTPSIRIESPPVPLRARPLLLPSILLLLLAFGLVWGSSWAGIDAPLLGLLAAVVGGLLGRVGQGFGAHPNGGTVLHP